MLNRLGFVASVLSENLSTSRTCRVRNATPLRLRELIDDNLAALDRVVTFLERERIGLYRISSGLIPFASHEVNRVPWPERYADELRRIGGRLTAAGVRVSMHPGQYTVLNSLNPRVVEASRLELQYHATLLDALGTDASSKIVLHVGGLFTDGLDAAIDRFVTVAAALPESIRRRLVVENDDRLFHADHALGVARRLGVPVVFDWLHHQAHPAPRPVAGLLTEVFATWQPSDGIPKVHLSSQAADGPRGAHADFVEVEDALAMFAQAPPMLFDCMLEAKHKEKALLRLRARLRARGVTEQMLEVHTT